MRFWLKTLPDEGTYRRNFHFAWLPKVVFRDRYEKETCVIWFEAYEAREKWTRWGQTAGYDDEKYYLVHKGPEPVTKKEKE